MGEVPFGELMALLDTNNRWVYKGSLTTPPCSKTIFFNVLYKVYPIKQYHVSMFKSQLDRVHNLEEKGNFRMTQPIDVQDPKLITNWTKDIKSDYFWLLVVLIALVSVMIFGLVVVGCVLALKSQRKHAKESRSDVYKEK